MDWSFRDNWDEYTWAKEIRKDELRIAGYFSALKTCLDLPGEEDMIFKRLMSQPELVPTGVTDPLRTLKADMEMLDEDSEENDSLSNRRRNTFEPARRVEKIVVEWNLLAAAHLPVKFNKNVLAVTCAFGKLLSRIYNFMETEDSSVTLPLRVSLLKHILSDLNETVQQLQSIHECLPEGVPADFSEKFFTPLAFVRELVIDKIKELNK
ncbi:MAG: hypothetical protein J6Q81_07455 [Lentisphaeria bacterium]|nr:hypothetical protein [Lentisphaeria bacterium]